MAQVGESGLDVAELRAGVLVLLGWEVDDEARPGELPAVDDEHRSEGHVTARAQARR
jgi:hypothetical protein